MNLGAIREKASILSKEIESKLKIKKENRDFKITSYSQFKFFLECPHRWKLLYIENRKKNESSIHMTFGTAMHKVIQENLDEIFNNNISTEYAQLQENLLQDLYNTYEKDFKRNGGVHFSSSEELHEFYLEGLSILKYFRDNQRILLNTSNYELIGYEIPIFHRILSEESSVYLMAYLDLVLYNKLFNRIEIIDLKTSGRGWFKKDQEDPAKIAQVVLYKKYFSKQYGIPESEIEVKFYILKRKVSGNYTDRIQVFTPNINKESFDFYVSYFENFLRYSYKDDGSFNTEKRYPAISGLKSKNCKFCEFDEQPELCPKSARVETLPS